MYIGEKRDLVEKRGSKRVSGLKLLRLLFVTRDVILS